MFDIGASELLLTVIVAIVVIGPKDLPLALRTAGHWIGKIRRVSGHFRTGVETMIREAELEEMEQKWREQNAQIMADTAVEPSTGAIDAPQMAEAPQMEGPLALPEHAAPEHDPAAAESAAAKEPELPLASPPPS